MIKVSDVTTSAIIYFLPDGGHPVALLQSLSSQLHWYLHAIPYFLGPHSIWFILHLVFD